LIKTDTSDASRAAMTDPAKQRGEARNASSPSLKLKPVPDIALSAVGDTLRENGLAAPITGGGTTFLQAKTANEVLKAQERKLKLAKLKGELIDRDRAVGLVFRLAREERDAWVTWPPRAAALMAIVGKLGCSSDSLRVWVRQVQRDGGERPGQTSEEKARIKQLERENRELRQANEILRKASAYFAQAELDRPFRK